MELNVKNIKKSFGEKLVLNDISFDVKSGRPLGLLGRNGSGKTTTIRVIMDIFPADSGEVTIDGKSNKKTTVKIGYLPEERGLYPKKLVSDQMSYFGQLRGLSPSKAKENGRELLKKLEAEEYFNKKLETLSKGNQQKIQLAIAVINDPDIVILDEPFSGLDPVNSRLLKNLVEETAAKGKLVLFSSHQMNYVEEFCDDICIINKGSIVSSGSIKQIKKSYPRNKILLLADHDKLDALQNAIKSDSILAGSLQSIEKHGDGLILSLKSEKDKAIVFSSSVFAPFDIDGLKVIEPTLEQIFVDKAGDNE